MSSLTKVQYREELKVRSSVVASMEDADIDTFIDAALRVYSGRLPKVKWSIDNTVVAGQEIYDFPSNALRIVSVRTTDNREPVHFAIEDRGSGNQIRLGSIQKHSFEGLLQQSYYSDPLNFQSDSLVVVSTETIVSGEAIGYSAFDVEYAELQTIPTVAEEALETLAFYVDYLALNKKAEESAEDMSERSDKSVSSITDSDSTGVSVTTTFDSQSVVTKRLEERAAEKLKKFEEETKQVHYGIRG